jgi:GTP 3',8-cyclase
MTNSANRRPVSIRISVTDRCQLRCAYCMPPEGIPERPRGDILSFEEIVRFVRGIQAGFDLLKVRITGGEPLIRRGIVRLVAMLAELGPKDLALTTNGQALAGIADDLKRAGPHRVNVRLDSVNGTTYKLVTRGGDLVRTLEGIEEALRVGLTPVKTNTVVIRGFNDDEVPDIVHYAVAHGCHARFLELMPIGFARNGFTARFVPTSEIRARVEASVRLTPLDGEAGTSSRDFLAVDASGRRGAVGFISSESNPFCSGCNRLRLTSTGELVACLARNESMFIRDLLRTDAPETATALRKLVARALDGKCDRASFDSTGLMAAVGG